MTQLMKQQQVLNMQERKEHLARTYGLKVEALRNAGDYKGGTLFTYSGTGWKEGTKFYVSKDGKAGIV